MYFTTSRVLQKKETINLAKVISTLKTIAILSLLMYAGYVSLYSMNLANQYATLSTEYTNLEKQYTTLTEKYDTISLQYETTVSAYDEHVDSLNEVIDELDTQNISLAKTNDQYYNELQAFSEREELFDKYEYAIYDKQHVRTDITYDRLKTAEDLCKEKGVDIDYVLSTIMVESGGKETITNPNSTAAGFGQMLDSTATYVYENIMENGSGTYDHSMALDGDTNLNMTIEYIAYLQDRVSTPYQLVERYRGVEDLEYIDRLNSYLIQKNKSVGSLRFG